MAYSPWPGFVDRIYVRVATSPQGPWTAAGGGPAAGLPDTVGGATYYCYAGTTQPWLSATGPLGFGYMDQSYDADTRGASTWRPPSPSASCRPP